MGSRQKKAQVCRLHGVLYAKCGSPTYEAAVSLFMMCPIRRLRNSSILLWLSHGDLEYVHIYRVYEEQSYINITVLTLGIPDYDWSTTSLREPCTILRDSPYLRILYVGTSHVVKPTGLTLSQFTI